MLAVFDALFNSNKFQTYCLKMMQKVGTFPMLEGQQLQENNYKHREMVSFLGCQAVMKKINKNMRLF